jgi:tetratricopeptide (TPR) repeat protein
VPPTERKEWNRREQLLNKADALAIEADLLAYNSKYEEALKKYDEALSIYPSNPDLWAFKAITLQGGLKRDEEALKCWERAKKLDRVVADAFTDKPIEDKPLTEADLAGLADDSCREKIKKLMLKSRK